MQFLAAISLEIIDSKVKIIVDVLAIAVIGKPRTPQGIITLSLMVVLRDCNSNLFYYMLGKLFNQIHA